jgi:hypothetical protein
MKTFNRNGRGQKSRDAFLLAVLCTGGQCGFDRVLEIDFASARGTGYC